MHLFTSLSHNLCHTMHLVINLATSLIASNSARTSQAVFHAEVINHLQVGSMRSLAVLASRVCSCAVVNSMKAIVFEGLLICRVLPKNRCPCGSCDMTQLHLHPKFVTNHICILRGVRSQCSCAATCIPRSPMALTRSSCGKPRAWGQPWSMSWVRFCIHSCPSRPPQPPFVRGHIWPDSYQQPVVWLVHHPLYPLHSRPCLQGNSASRSTHSMMHPGAPSVPLPGRVGQSALVLASHAVSMASHPFDSVAASVPHLPLPLWAHSLATLSLLPCDVLCPSPALHCFHPPSLGKCSLALLPQVTLTSSCQTVQPGSCQTTSCTLGSIPRSSCCA